MRNLFSTKQLNSSQIGLLRPPGPGDCGDQCMTGCVSACGSSCTYYCIAYCKDSCNASCHDFCGTLLML